MSTLAEIEEAARSLSAEQKQDLLLSLAVQLRSEGGLLPEPRQFTPEQMAQWIAQDEADMARFRREE